MPLSRDSAWKLDLLFTSGVGGEDKALRILAVNTWMGNPELCRTRFLDHFWMLFTESSLLEKRPLFLELVMTTPAFL